MADKQRPSFMSRARQWDIDIDHYADRYIPASQLYRLPKPISRFLGYREKPQHDVGNVLGAFWSLLGAFCGLGVIAAVFNNTAVIQAHSPPVLIASFVSSPSSSSSVFLLGCRSLSLFVGDAKKKGLFPSPTNNDNKRCS